jgi:hypothetical protein
MFFINVNPISLLVFGPLGSSTSDFQTVDKPQLENTVETKFVAFIYSEGEIKAGRFSTSYRPGFNSLRVI